MPRLSLWNTIKTHDFNFVDRIVGEHIFAGGTGVLCHRYEGIADTPYQGDSTQPSSGGQANEVFIQDLLFLENRDRKYSDTIFQLRGSYSIADHSDFDLTQFGFFLANDQLMMTFHENSMVQALGRRLMPGDVLELPHLRDDLLLGKSGGVNHFYVVKEGARPAEGYDPRWWSHLWRVKLGTITDSQEFRDLLGTGEDEKDLRNLISTYNTQIDINDRVLEQAAVEVPHKVHTRVTYHLYFDPHQKDLPPDVVYYSDDDGLPADGTMPVGDGDSMPLDAQPGDYFLRTDFAPPRLFQKSQDNRWIKITDVSRSTPWTSANRALSTFINNDNITINSDESTQAERVNMSKVVMPRNDVKPRNRPLGE